MLNDATFLVLGSNLGDSTRTLRQAIQMISHYMQIERVSSVYRSRSILENQPDYFNQAIMVQESYEPEELLRILKSIEYKLGRESDLRWASRIIDIDIIFKGQLVYSSDMLVIPHSEFLKRDFVLKPIAEIAPKFIPPNFSSHMKDFKVEISYLIEELV